MTRTGKAPLPYFGGKQQLAPFIVAQMPPHISYVEPFGGAAAVLFCKPPSRLETYNDVDSGLVNLFRVLRDEKRRKRLVKLLDLTPYAREEWAECRASWRDAPDEVEMARRWFVLAWQSFAGRITHSSGWRYAAVVNHVPTESWRSAIGRLDAFGQRLRYVQIEHMDFERCIRAYDTPDTLIYADPPYLPETRKKAGDGYEHEMSREDHARLLGVLVSAKGMVILSGYDSPLYRDALAGWECLRMQVQCSAAGRTKRAGLQGKGAVYQAGQTREECLWLSPACQHAQPSLFAGLDGLGMGVAG